MISCSFILAEFSMLLRERMKLIGWFLSHDLLCAWGILKSLNVFISMRRGRAWKKRARRTATASLPLWAAYRASTFEITNLSAQKTRYVNGPQDSHWYSPAVSEGYLFVRAETLCHSAWVPRWDVLGLKLLCLNWQDLKHVRIKNFLEEAALAWSLR